jgi:nucleoside 2-deoxyribosyltransferase
MKYLRNTLESQFGLAPDTHEEFSKVFRQNCDYLGIGAGFSARSQAAQPSQSGSSDSESSQARETVTLAEPDTDTGLTAFVIMPFRERDKQHSGGFFSEVLQSLIAPAGRQAGFKVTTANRQGSDVIQSTIVNDLLRADLVIADLTEHNPNVLFELGLRMAFDKPVALIRAKGTEPIFDVDNMLRVYDYDPNLWASSIERDLPKLMQHLKATWDGKDSESTYMKILHHEPAKQAAATASASSED